jgi:hypothetical protein
LSTLTSNLSQRLIEFKNRYEAVKPEAIEKMAIQLANNCVNGSPYESVVPPVWKETLRGSVKKEVEGNTIWIAFDTAYAARMHEELTPAGDFQLGKRSVQAGNVGGKFLEKHLYNADEIQSLFDMFGTKLKEDVFS